MSLAKFMSLLQTSSLYFANLDILADGDPYEGFLPLGNFRHRQLSGPGDLTHEERLSLHHYGTQPFSEPLAFKRYCELRELRIR